jgi:predicted permease
MGALREWLSILRLRFRALVHRRHLDRDLEDEVCFHLQSRAARYREQGLEPAEADRRARRAFGNPTSFRERLKDMWTFQWLEDLRQDVRGAIRMLRRTPTFAATAVLTLALGIGAGTAIFSVVNTVLLRPLPYDDPDGIYRIRTMDVRGLPLGTVGRAHVDPLNEQSTSVQAAAYGLRQVSSVVGRDGVARPLSEYFASEEFFDVFTDPLALGRGFEADDGGATVLSHRVWRDAFRSDPEILGSVVILNGDQRLVTGVAAPGFEFPAGTGAWTRIRIDPGDQASDVVTNMDGYARLRPGATGAQLQAELAVLAGNLGPWPDGHALRFVSIPLLQDVVGAFGATILLLSAAAAVLLLVACLNVANLLLTRGTVRAREIAVRGALGAGRWRVVRQLLAETAVLCVVGGTLGLALAAAAVRLAGTIGFAGLPRLDGLAIDGRVLLFTAGCTLATVLVVGVAPALRRTGGNLAGLMSEGGRSATGGPRRSRLFGALVVAEVALAVTLVIGAGLLVRSYVRVASIDLGFNPDRLVTVSLNVTGRIGDAGADYLPVARFYQELMGRIRAMPGVAAVAATSHAPLEPGLVSGAPFLLPGETFDPQAVRQTQTLQVSPDYLEVMGIRPVAGRLLRPADRRDALGVVLVNEAFVRAVYTGRDGVGERLVFPGAALWSRGGMAFHLGVMATAAFEIVGVIPDIRQSRVLDEPQPTVYFPHEQWTVRRMALVVRAEGDDPRALIPGIRAELAAMDPTIPPGFEVYGEIVSAATARQRLGTALLAAFGLASLVLAAVGIYGLLSYSVSQRTAEIAVRLALGARSGEVPGMIVAWALRLALAGIVLGLGGAWAMRALVASQLYEISAFDPLVFVAVPVTILAVALLSSYLPARRAAGIDPAVALRAE